MTWKIGHLEQPSEAPADPEIFFDDKRAHAHAGCRFNKSALALTCGSQCEFVHLLLRSNSLHNRACPVGCDWRKANEIVFRLTRHCACNLLHHVVADVLAAYRTQSLHHVGVWRIGKDHLRWCSMFQTDNLLPHLDS